jgi:hypothetical protein
MEASSSSNIRKSATSLEGQRLAQQDGIMITVESGSCSNIRKRATSSRRRMLSTARRHVPTAIHVDV